MSTSCETALKWMQQNTFDAKSMLVQEMAGAVRQQAIAWANVDPDLCCQMALLCHNELIQIAFTTERFLMGISLMLIGTLKRTLRGGQVESQPKWPSIRAKAPVGFHIHDFNWMSD